LGRAEAPSATVPPMPEPTQAPPSVPCWWDDAPWNGTISQAEFDGVIDTYIAHFGYYTPALPPREPDVLRVWCVARGLARL
jgi:hypothetical protein